METNDARRLSPRAQEDLRRRVVRAVVDRGLKQLRWIETITVPATPAKMPATAAEIPGSCPKTSVREPTNAAVIIAASQMKTKDEIPTRERLMPKSIILPGEAEDCEGDSTPGF